MVYRYDQIFKKDKNKLFLIGVATVFALTLMVSVFSPVTAAPEDVESVPEYGFNGGGHILGEQDGASKRRKSVFDISFGSNVMVYDTGIEGELTVRFHNVSIDDLDKTTFHAEELTAFNYFDGDSATCNSAMNMTAFGRLNGESGYKVVFRAGDSGSPNDIDTVRVELYDGSSKVYDTHPSSDFVSDSNCVGTARTSLDKGNLTIEEWEIAETVAVPANDIDGVQSTTVLERGEKYMLKASGTASAGDTIDFDAQYSLTNRIGGDTWTDLVSGYEGYGTSLLDLFVDGNDGLWGPYNESHVYWLDYAGTGVSVDFLIYDAYYPNNTGSLLVDIFEVVN